MDKNTNLVLLPTYFLKLSLNILKYFINFVSVKDCFTMVILNKKFKGLTHPKVELWMKYFGRRNFSFKRWSLRTQVLKFENIVNAQNLFKRYSIDLKDLPDEGKYLIFNLYFIYAHTVELFDNAYDNHLQFLQCILNFCDRLKTIRISHNDFWGARSNWSEELSIIRNTLNNKSSSIENFYYASNLKNYESLPETITALAQNTTIKKVFLCYDQKEEKLAAEVKHSYVREMWKNIFVLSSYPFLLPLNNNLETLILKNLFEISKVQTDKLSEVIITSSNLYKLSLVNMNFPSDAIDQLIKSIGCNKTISELNFSGIKAFQKSKSIQSFCIAKRKSEVWWKCHRKFNDEELQVRN